MFRPLQNYLQLRVLSQTLHQAIPRYPLLSMSLLVQQHLLIYTHPFQFRTRLRTLLTQD